MKFLVEIERTIRDVARTAEAEREKGFRQADVIIRTATDIVELYTGEEAD